MTSVKNSARPHGNSGRLLVLFMLIIGLCGVVVSNGTATGKISPRLMSVLNGMSDDGDVLAWVFFADKGSLEQVRYSVPADVVSPRSIQRRLKVRSIGDVVDYSDLAVEERYVEQVRSGVLAIRQRSKWFNAVSVRASKAQIEKLGDLTFVRQIDLVARFRRNGMEENSRNVPPQDQNPDSPPDGTEALDYGPSFGQNNQINVVAVHNSGNYAQGVMVGVFDNGFRLLTHETFDSLDIVATYDFVDHKVSVVPNNPDPSFGSHGIYTLSTIGGYTSGELIGPAFGASFILARTENDSSETPIEEDNWAAAIEWADSIGVDVTSTSLGYTVYDPPYPSWTWEDMDGNTTVITRAADMAVARGIVVVNSAGNSGSNSSHNTLVAPADGDSVIAVGAVSSSGQRATFSSVGPTTSNPPRIKPDVMALGVSTHCASPTNRTGYTSVSGTSLSCPLAAGVAALVVHDRPAATPVEIGDAMRLTADNASSPNNQYGWGILNAADAIDFIAPGGGVPCGDITSFQARCTGGSTFSLQFRINLLNNTIHAGETVTFDVDGTMYDATIFTNGTHSRAQVIVAGAPAGSHTISLIDPPGCFDPIVVTCGTTRQDEAGWELTDALWNGAAGGTDTAPSSTGLLGNFPNPFNPSTTVRYTLSDETHVTLRVYNMLGQLVKTLVDDYRKQGSYQAVWDGTNESGAAVSSGMYIYRMTAGRVVETRRMLLLK